MNEETKHKNFPDSPKNEPNIAAQLQQIQQHLVYLEKKIDTLLQSQSAGSGGFQRKPFSRPRPSFGHGGGAPRHGRDRHERGDRGDRPFNREGNRERSFDRPGGGGFDKPSGGGFDKPRNENRGGFFPKKKRFRQRD